MEKNANLNLPYESKTYIPYACKKLVVERSEDMENITYQTLNKRNSIRDTRWTLKEMDWAYEL